MVGPSKSVDMTVVRMNGQVGTAVIRSPEQELYVGGTCLDYVDIAFTPEVVGDVNLATTTLLSVTSSTAQRIVVDAWTNAQTDVRDCLKLYDSEGLEPSCCDRDQNVSEQ